MTGLTLKAEIQFLVHFQEEFRQFIIQSWS